MISKKKIDEIVNKIVANYNPDKIIIFGSYAKGTAKDSSDLDLFIIKDTDMPRSLRAKEVKRLLYGSMIPVDINVYTNQEVNEGKDIKFSFIDRIMHPNLEEPSYSKVVYEKRE